MIRLAQARRIAPLVAILALTTRGSAQIVTPTAGPPPGQRTGLIVGQVVDAATGAPVGEAIVRLTLLKYFEDPTTPKGRVMADGEGRFFFTDLHPGEYFLQAEKDGYSPGMCGQRRARGQNQLLSLAEGERLTEFRGASTPPPAVPGLAFETPFGEPGQFFVQTTKGATLSFATVAAGGQYIVRPYETSAWFVHSVTLGSKNITDRVFDLQADTTSLVVTFTDRPSKVSGTVTDERGAPSQTAVVVVFPVDPRLWSGYGESSRALKSALTTRSGVYTINHVPPGDYYAIALADSDIDGWRDPAILETLAEQATKLTVADGEAAKTLDLRVQAIR